MARKGEAAEPPPAAPWLPGPLRGPRTRLRLPTIRSFPSVPPAPSEGDASSRRSCCDRVSHPAALAWRSGACAQPSAPPAVSRQRGARGCRTELFRSQLRCAWLRGGAISFIRETSALAAVGAEQRSKGLLLRVSRLPPAPSSRRRARLRAGSGLRARTGTVCPSGALRPFPGLRPAPGAALCPGSTAQQAGSARSCSAALVLRFIN